jgi:hypothetical protein
MVESATDTEGKNFDSGNSCYRFLLPATQSHELDTFKSFS